MFLTLSMNLIIERDNRKGSVTGNYSIIILYNNAATGGEGCRAWYTRMYVSCPNRPSSSLKASATSGALGLGSRGTRAWQEKGRGEGVNWRQRKRQQASVGVSWRQQASVSVSWRQQASAGISGRQLASAGVNKRQ